jgi:hypothetical protein
MIGMVAAKARQNGRMKSDSSPNIRKTNQKIFRCIVKIVRQIHLNGLWLAREGRSPVPSLDWR